MRKCSTSTGIALVLFGVAAPRLSHAQSAWQVQQICHRLNTDPAYRPALNERVRENPAITGTLSGGFAMLNTSGGGFGSGDSIGMGLNVHAEAEVGLLHPLWARASAQFVGAGRYGFIGDVSVGFTARDYGVYFVPAGSQIYISRYSVSYSSWDNHCNLRRFDFRGFTGVRWGGFFSRDITDSNGVVSRSVPAEGWFAPQLGITMRWRFPNGRTTDTTIAGMFDLTHMSWGLYGRSYASYGPVFLGIDGGFFLPVDSSATSGRLPWSAFWFTVNLGYHFEV